jgi:ERCC4-type nuclease
MSLTIDHRERLLLDVLRKANVPHTLATLPVGDILCLCDGQPAWVAERKRADDLANSIKSGRWREQQCRLFGAGLSVVFIIEGDLRNTTMSYDSLLGAVVNTELRKTAHVYRTWDVNETSRLLQHLLRKIAAPQFKLSGLQAPPMLSKRKRDEDVNTCQTRQLMCIPSVSLNVARKLLDEFGSLSALQRALEDPDSFPRIGLDDRTFIGPKRIRTLTAYLLASG